MAFFGPSWWHHHGIKMTLKKFDKQNHLLIIAATAATLRITRRAGTVEEGWFVDWEIIYSQNEKTTGRVIFRSHELKAAFGLSNHRGTSNHLVEGYHSDSAVQGKYIRFQECLNIPCPGTGHDGDPNISLEIDQIMRDAICQLLE